VALLLRSCLNADPAFPFLATASGAGSQRSSG
jgi:hypothetical protein